MKIYRLRFLLVVLALALLTGTFWADGAPVAATSTPDRPVVVRIEFDTPEELRALAAELDVWEVHHEAGYLVALVEPAQFASLTAAGYPLEVDEVRSTHPDTIPGYPCYRTITELYADLDHIVADHPDLTDLSTIGQSYEGRPIKVLRLTNEAIVKDKPIFFLMANIHGRELITPETAMVFIDFLTDNYDLDPDVTWLLDHHEVQVSVSTNPDGHVKNEPGEPWAWWRKNTHPYGSCSPDDIGVDLNRNHSFKWGCCGGSSGNPCAETYRGPYHASEPETQVVQDYVRTLFPDQRGPGDTDPAPADATGVLITLHSYSNLVLWPWGWTTTPAPNSSGLQALGVKMASYNGYQPSQSVGLYPTDGTTDDWSYGEMGIASYTFEIGSAGDGFYPSCSRYDALVQPNIPALFYAAKVARTPYMTAHGPDALSVDVDPGFALGGNPVQLTASIDDGDNGGNPILAAEYYVDTPPWDGGSAVSMSAADGAFGEVVEAVEASVPTAGWTPGRHILFVRGQDSGGNWGPVSAVFVETDVDSFVDGHVTDAGTAAPIAGADLLLEGASDVFTTTTDASGYYVVPVYSGVYTVTASAFGYGPEVAGGVTATTGMTTTQDFGLAASPTGTVTGTVLELGTNAPLVADLVVANSPVSVTTGVSGTYDLILPVGTYTITASAPGHESRTVSGVSVAAGETTGLDVLLRPPPCLLLVDDDYSGSLPHEYETYYEAALRSLGLYYDTWSVQVDGYPGVADLADYGAVLWFTGDVRYGTLNVTEQAALRQYLVEGGGALLLSGQNIAFDIAGDSGDFMSDVLGTDFVLDDAGLTELEGGGLLAGQTLSLAGGDGAGNQDSPDVITPQAGATSVLTYTGDGVGGVALDTGGYRSLFLSFGLEGINSAADRESVLETGLSWLGCSAVPVDLRIGKKGPLAPVQPGDLLTYTLALTNHSAIPLTGLVVSDTLPGELDFVSASPPASWDGTAVRWSDLTIASEGQLTLSLVAEVRAGVIDGTLIRNAEYGAVSVQMSAPVVGTDVVDTPVVAPGIRLFLPLILRETSD